MNSKLYSNQYNIPKQTLDNLKKYEFNETVRNLLQTKKISYPLLKKMKHRMENGEKDQLGGEPMLSWVNQTLNSDRSSIETTNKAKSDAGQSNVYIRSHSKDNLKNLNRPSKSHSSNLADIKITETLKLINSIMLND